MKEYLGKEGRDKITGFEGIITSYAVHLYGCSTYWLTPKKDKEGKLPEGGWFDEGRVEIIGCGINPNAVIAEKNGAENVGSPYRKK